MTLIVTSLVIGYLMIREVFKPVLQYNAWRSRQQYEEELRYYQLRVVKNFYPVLREYSLKEIDERFGLQNVYDTVGRAYLQRR